MSPPAVSVIMTVHNGAQYLRAAIESIRKQTVRDLEFVIVDDGSTDGTSGVLVEARGDPRVRIITSQWVGRACALNIAWRHTSGDLIANLDADDLAEPDRLEEQVAFLQENPEVGLLGTAWAVFTDDDAPPARIVHPPLGSAELKRALIRHYPFIHSSTMFTRRALEKVNGYNEGYRVCIDYEISARVARQCEVANLPDVLTWKRKNLSSWFARVGAWDRYSAVVRIRWIAWCAFSGNFAELPHVFNGGDILRLVIGRQVYRLVRSRFSHALGDSHGKRSLG